MQKDIAHHLALKTPGCVLKDLKRNLQQVASLSQGFLLTNVLSLLLL